MQQRRIDTLRRLKGKLINAQPLNKSDMIDNVFTSGSTGHMTLSLYERPRSICLPSPYGEVVANRSQMNVSRHSDNEEHRMEQLREIGQLKAHLARDRVDCNVLTLERAILLPD